MNLIKLLAITPKHWTHRDQVLEAFWPALEPSAASTQLYKAIHYARKALHTANKKIHSEDILTFNNEVLSLTAPGGVHTDVDAFRDYSQKARQSGTVMAFRQAIGCYAGDLLPADLYEKWTDELREFLRLTLLELLIDMGELCLQTSYLADAADTFRRALTIDELNETAHRGLMRTFALQGSRSQALHQYKRCCEILSRELEVTPSPETVKLNADIVSGKNTPSAKRAARAGKPPTMSCALNLPKSGPLIGRTEGMKAVSKALDSFSQNSGGVLIFEGMAGIGKTRLAHEIYETAQRRGVTTGTLPTFISLGADAMAAQARSAIKQIKTM